MAQRLIQPINDMRITVSYKWGTKYKTDYNLGDHYGQDSVGSTTVYAQGNGVVKAVGYDRVCGNVVVIVYDEECVNHMTGETAPLTGRYMHLDSTRVAVGQRVNKDTIIGKMGATGQYVDGKHLHFELDKDVKYPTYTPTLAGNSNILKAGTRGAKDTTVDPMQWTHTKASAPDNQQVVAANGREWVDPRDANLPKL